MCDNGIEVGPRSSNTKSSVFVVPGYFTYKSLSAGWHVELLSTDIVGL